MDAIRHRMLEGLHAAGFTDLIPAHLVVLGYPGPDNRRPSELALQTGMTKQALNYLLGQLEKAGYLIRVEDPDVHRSKLIRLTKRGPAAMRTIRSTVQEVETQLEVELGRRDLEDLRHLLVRLNATSLVTLYRRLSNGGEPARSSSAHPQA